MSNLKEWAKVNKPIMLEQFLPIANKGNQISDYTTADSRTICWRCSKGHGWFVKPYNRLQNERGEGCHICNNLVIVPNVNDLKTRYDELSKEYSALNHDFYWMSVDGPLKTHFKKTNPLSIDRINPTSKNEVIWNGKCGHSWSAEIKSRRAGNGCPYCASNKVLEGFNDLASVYPEVSSEWDYDNNHPVTPTDVFANSNKIYSWICKGCGTHSTKSVDHKVKRGCDICSRSAHVSLGEKAIVFYLNKAHLFPEENYHNE